MHLSSIEAIAFSQASRKAQRWIPVISHITEHIRDAEFFQMEQFMLDDFIKNLSEVTTESLSSAEILNSAMVRESLAAIADAPIRINGRLQISAHHVALDLTISWQELLWINVSKQPEKDLPRPELTGDAGWLRNFQWSQVRQAILELSETYDLRSIAGDIRTKIERERAKTLQLNPVPFIPSESAIVRLTEPKPIVVAEAMANSSSIPAAGLETKDDMNVPRHSPDFASIIWFGKAYEFPKPLQSACVRVLWEGWRSKTPAIREATILESIESESPIRTIFQGHPAYGALIVKSGKSSFKLNEPTSNI